MDDKIRRVEIDGYIYYKLYVACPVCREQGKSRVAVYREHEGCGGNIMTR